MAMLKEYINPDILPKQQALRPHEFIFQFLDPCQNPIFNFRIILKSYFDRSKFNKKIFSMSCLSNI